MPWTRKPYDDFPLTPHAKGWAKRIAGTGRTMVICGRVPPEQALAIWKDREQEFVVRAKALGLRKRVDDNNVRSMSQLVNLYLNQRSKDVAAGTLLGSSFVEIKNAVMLLMRVTRDVPVDDVGPSHFRRLVDRLADLSPKTRRNYGQAIRSMFRFAADEEWIDRTPGFGRAFQERARLGLKIDAKHDIFSAGEAAQLWAFVEGQTKREGIDPLPALQMLACVLLGLNGAMGPKDLSRLKWEMIREGVVYSHRFKGRTLKPVEHTIPLWRETEKAIDAVRAAWAARGVHNDLVFLTRQGNPLTFDVSHRVGQRVDRVTRNSGLATTFSRYLKLAGLAKPGRSFYSLRHTHRSVSGGAKDEPAADVLAGHRLPGIRAVYQQVDVQRLRHVADFVREWLEAGKRELHLRSQSSLRRGAAKGEKKTNVENRPSSRSRRTPLRRRRGTE